MVSPRTGKLLSQKYINIPQRVAKLETSEVTQIFRNNLQVNTYYPRIAMFGGEFCLGYCYNLSNNKKNGSNDSLQIGSTVD